ncbi:hypothetical protein, partial [Escherichia coli]|uniref:hypothetical protein n=1 Tax=Escherichia coli TaxID=562 RepID=UPI00396C6629
KPVTDNTPVSMPVNTATARIFILPPEQTDTRCLLYIFIHHPHLELTLTGLHAVTAFVPGGETDGETDVNIQCLMLNA